MEPIESEQVNVQFAGERETKFVFDARRAPHVLGLLRARCRPDGTYPAGIVSSIYYDTPGWYHLDEKRNGDYVKAKVRVRWYAAIESREPVGHAWLEAKLKRGARRRKLRRETEITGARLAGLPLDGRELLELPRRLRAEGLPIPGNLRPTFEIAYERHRFVERETGARICVDTDIRVPRVNPARVPPPPPMPRREAVLEVKGELDDLPPSLADLRRIGCRKQAFSKYGASFQLVTGVAR